LTPLLIGFAALLGALALAIIWLRLSIEVQDVWSIALYAGPDPFRLVPHPAIGDRPILRAADVTDAKARFVADPFLWRSQDRWHLLFEVYDETVRRGVIAVADSIDGVRWSYDRVVLREPFHLSYPYIFEDAGELYMIPESGEAQAVRLYRAPRFPHEWRHEATLLEGTFFDASPFKHEGHWWMFAMDATHSLRLFGAPQLHGPWQEHPCSPVVVRDRKVGRPGGRVLEYEGALYRFAQDGEPTYGSSVRVLRISKLTATEYAETQVAGNPMLRGAGAGWNATGMHHIDACRDGEGWIASVDGNRQRRVWNWRLGARLLQRKIAGVLPSRPTVQ
jgi:hypothetical protein